jgi:hypothetical protein
MNDHQEQLGTTDLGLLLFVLVTVAILLFQSSLF